MGADYTPEQLAAVVRVMKLKVTDYYGILRVEKTCTAVEVKKAYRKLAVVVHPDKNKAPESDEAFKRVSKSFQILSDDSKRKVFDQTGSDPDSRAAGYGPRPDGAGGFASAFNGQPFGARQRFQGRQFGGGDDIFNMFFGGGGPQPQFQFQFGGPGGASAFGPDIFSTFFGDAFGQAPPNRAQQQQQQQAREENSKWMNVVIIVALLFMSPLFSWLTGSSGSSLPRFRFNEETPYTQEFTTPKYKVPFFVNPREVTEISASTKRRLEREAETEFVSRTSRACQSEYLQRQELMQDATGWFSVDTEKYNAAKAMPLPHCDLLKQLNIPIQK